MSEAKVYPVKESAKSRALIDSAKYQEMYDQSINDPEGFWGESIANYRTC